MICLLNFCHKDRDQALNLVRWIGELGGCKGHDLILQSSITAAANGLVSELEVAAHDLFDSVTTRVTDIQDERGWPYSCNTAWLDAVMFMRYRPARPWLFTKLEHPPGTPKWKEEAAAASIKLTVPWFWMEPDCVPLTKDWLDKLAAAYAECSARGKQAKYFLGGEVKQPEHRMSGVGVYPCKVAEFTRGFPFLSNNPAPWDQVLAQDFAPHVEYTPLIQNVWNWVPGDKESAPKFPQISALLLIDPNAVLFHRCKDGSLIERLREQKSSACVSGLNVSSSSPNRNDEQERGPVAKPITHGTPPAGSNPAAEASSRLPSLEHVKLAAENNDLQLQIKLLKKQLALSSQHLRVEDMKLEETKADLRKQKKVTDEAKRAVMSEKMKAIWARRREAKLLSMIKA